MTLLLLACAGLSDAERVRASGDAPDFLTAMDICPEADGACKMEAVVRFAAWPRCADVPHPWDDECRFRQAEAVERTDDGPAAFALCHSTIYEVGCATHVAGQQARRTEAVTDAAERWERLAPHTNERFAFDYWRGFWRTHIDRGDAPAIESCPSRVCRDAGGREIEATVHTLAIPCGAAREPPGWIPAGSVASKAAWDAALSRHCVGG